MLGFGAYMISLVPVLPFQIISGLAVFGSFIGYSKLLYKQYKDNRWYKQHKWDIVLNIKIL